MQNQKSLTIHSHSFAGWGRECVAFVFALKGGQYLINECLQSIATDITQDEKLNISDATLTLILWMGQRQYHFLFAYKDCEYIGYT